MEIIVDAPRTGKTTKLFMSFLGDETGIFVVSGRHEQQRIKALVFDFYREMMDNLRRNASSQVEYREEKTKIIRLQETKQNRVVTLRDILSKKMRNPHTKAVNVYLDNADMILQDLFMDERMKLSSLTMTRLKDGPVSIKL